MRRDKELALSTESLIKFRFLKLWLRILTLIFGAGMIAVNILTYNTERYSIVSLIIGIIFLSISLIENSWEFDLTKKQAIQKKGFILFPKKTRIKFSVINSLTIETYKQPARWGTFTEIYMFLEDGKKITIGKDKTKRLDKEIANVAIIQDLIRQEKHD